MHAFKTPAAGRTPSPNIADGDCYKLDIRVLEYDQNIYLIKLRRWIPETGWRQTEMFVNPEELARIQDSLNNPSMKRTKY